VFACHSTEAWRSKLQEAIDTKRLVIFHFQCLQRFFVLPFFVNFVSALCVYAPGIEPWWVAHSFDVILCGLISQTGIFYFNIFSIYYR